MMLSHTAYGSDGPAILIIHGLFGSGRNWTSLARTLSEHSYRVFCLDLPNHGQSPWAAETLSYPFMADCIKSWMLQQKIESATILGHSMGGKVAMTVALSSPEHVSSLIVADIAPVTYESHEHLHLIHALQNVDLTQYTRRQEVENVLSTDIPNEAIRKFLTHNIILDPQNNQLKWTLNLQGLADSLTEIRSFPKFDSTDSFKKASLFLVGGHSDYVKDADRGTIQALFPQSQLVCMEACGHWLHAEDPKTFTQHVISFLAR